MKLTRIYRKGASLPSNTIIIFMISYAFELSNTTSEYVIVVMFVIFCARNKSYTPSNYIYDPVSYRNLYP
jgi:hypothetical protein